MDVSRKLLSISFYVLCVSCHRPEIDASQSLVGAKKLPPAKELKGETIGIYFGSDRSLTRELSYELRPDNSLTITISDVYPGKRSVAQRVQIDSAVADSVRMKLWRLRPEELKGVAWTVQPAGCPPPPTDTSPMLSIGFIKEGPKPGVDDDRIGVFTLPYPATCSTRQGKTARDLVGEALRLLPGSGLRSQYLYHRPLP